MSAQLRHHCTTQMIKSLTRQINTSNLNHQALRLNFSRDFRKNPVGPTGRHCKVHQSQPSFASSSHKCRKLRRTIVAEQRAKELQNLLHLSPTMSHRKWIEYQTTRDRLGGRVTAQNKMIAMHCNHRSLKSQLHKATTSGRNLRRSLEHPHTAQHFRCSDVKTYSRPRTQRARRTRQHVDPNIDNLRRPQMS